MHHESRFSTISRPPDPHYPRPTAPEHLETPRIHPRSTTHSTERGRARFAVAVWVVFALAIGAATLLKSDLFVRTDGSRFTAAVAGETATEWMLFARSDTPPDAPDASRPWVDHLPKSEIAEHHAYGARSVTPEYDRAARRWWRSRTLYTGGEHGFLYMPQSAMVYSPFTPLPPALEETTCRVLGIAAYALGIWGLCRRLFGETRGTAFLLATALAVPAALGSATNGQTNVHMAGLFALTACATMDRRWWTATLWLMLALACKPTSMVMVLLFGAIWWRPMSWRLAIGIAAFLAAPFLHPDPAFVLGQYREFVDKAVRAAAPPDLFQDIRGLLVSFGLPAPERVLTAVRGIAALGTLGLCWLAVRRFPAVGPVFVLALGAIYLMLFNPRTEGLSYVILGPAAALWATREALARRWPTFAGLLLLCLAFQFSTQMALGHKNYWVRPLGTILFAGLVVAEIARRRTGWPRPEYDADVPRSTSSSAHSEPTA